MPKFIAELKPSTDEFALIDSNNIRGGYMQCTNESKRDSLVSDKLKVGMRCYVQTSGTVYEYDGTKWINPDVTRDIEFLDQTPQKVRKVQDASESFWAVDIDDSSIFVAGDIVAWDFSCDETGNIIVSGCSTIFSNPTTKSQILVSKPIVGRRPYPRNVIAKIGSTIAGEGSQRSIVMVAHNIPNCRAITCFKNCELDNLFKDYTFRLGWDTNTGSRLFAKQVHLEGTFINSEGVNIEDNIAKAQLTANRAENNTDDLFQRYQDLEGRVNGIDTNTENISELKSAVKTNTSTIATVKTTADEALATANRVKDVSIDLGTRVNDLETVTSSHSNTITGIQGKVSELEEKVNTNTGSIGTLDSKVKLNTTNVTIAKSTADLALSNANSLSGQVEEINNQITDINDQITTVSGTVESLSEEVYRASDTAIEAYDMGVALTPKVTALETKSTELTTAVAAAAADATEAKTVSTSLNTRVGTVESTVSSLSTTMEGIYETANNADTKSTQNSTLITELTQQVTAATETANSASTLANNMSNVIGTIQSNASDALNSSTAALDALGGKKIVVILETEYHLLSEKDPDTIYFCMLDTGGSGASLD